MVYKIKYGSQTLLDALRSILLQGIAGTQEELRSALSIKGFDVNQSKVSRMLRKIGAVKVTNEENQIVYRLPKEPTPPSAMSTLSHLVLDIVANDTMVVIHTSPGSASLIARMLDYNREKTSILGTIAGDDTIFVTPQLTKDIQQTLIEVKKLLFS